MESKDWAKFDSKMTMEQKRLLEEAAKLKGFKNLSEYVLTTMVNDALTVSKDYRETLYSERDKQKIMEVMINPTEFTPSFDNAFKRWISKQN